MYELNQHGNIVFTGARLPVRDERLTDAERVELEELRRVVKEAREQEPAIWVAFSECGQFIRYWTRDSKSLDATMAVNDFTVLEFYACPVPAAPAKFTDDDLAEIHQLAHELGGTESGEYVLDGEQLDSVIVRAASLFYKPVLAAGAVPAVPAEWREALATGAKWMRWWIEEQYCDCEGEHFCGLPQRRKELEKIEALLQSTEQTK